MRENRTYGSEGGGPNSIGPSYLYRPTGTACLPSTAARQWHDRIGMMRPFVMHGAQTPTDQRSILRSLSVAL